MALMNVPYWLAIELSKKRMASFAKKKFSSWGNRYPKRSRYPSRSRRWY